MIAVFLSQAIAYAARELHVVVLGGVGGPGGHVAGDIIAGGLFVLPGAVAITTLSYVYAGWGSVPIVVALLFGLKAAVLAIVVEAVFRIGKRALKNRILIGLASAAFVGIFFLSVPFPVIIFGAALIGFVGGRMGLAAFQGGNGHGSDKARDTVPIVDSLLGEELPEHVRPNVLRALQVLAVWFALWLIPVAALLWAFGSGNVFSQIAVFFSKMAMVTFGGAYAVLAYVAQRAVEHYAWLKPGEMLDGLGMAETTPGPLIMVLQFVGFMAASRDPGGLPPMLARPLVTDRDNPIFQYAAFNHFRIRRMMRGSPTRCSTKRTSQL